MSRVFFYFFFFFFFFKKKKKKIKKFGKKYNKSIKEEKLIETIFNELAGK